MILTSIGRCPMTISVKEVTVFSTVTGIWWVKERGISSYLVCWPISVRQVVGPPKTRGLGLCGKALETVLAKRQSWRWPDHSLLPPLLWIRSLLLLEAKAATGVPWKLTRQEAMMLGSLLGEIFISSLGRQTSWCKRKPTPSNWYTALTSCWEICRTGLNGILHSINCKQDVKD